MSEENLERQDMKGKKPGEALVGKVLFDRFEVLEVLGESAMALVLKAREVNTERLVAIKTVTPSDADSVKRFAQEVQLHGSLKHTNIVEAIDSLEAAGGRTFFIMEFLSGMSLHRVLQTQQRLENEDELASILLQICDALAHAHQFGVLHRDLKPGNIFLLEQNNKLNVKVLDFGIAKPLGQQTGLTQAGYSVGSPLYMSPEQCRGHKVDFRSDVYSLGILAYEMTTGKLPYGGHNIMTVMAAHCDPDRKPAHLNTQVPDLCRVDVLNDTIQTAMETDPAKRFQTISEFKQSVQKWHDAVRKEFLSTLVPREAQHPTIAANAAALSNQNVGGGTSDSQPRVPTDQALQAPSGAANTPESQALTPQQIAEQQEQLRQQEQLKQQKLLHQQMLEQQQIQPQQQHQLMQRQQMKPLPPSELQDLQLEQPTAQEPGSQAPPNGQGRRLVEETLIEFVPEPAPPKEQVQNPEKPLETAPNAVPAPNLRASDPQHSEKHSEPSAPPNSQKISAVGEQNSRLRNRLNVGDVGGTTPQTNKSKMIVMIVVVVTILLLIAFVVLSKLVLNPV